MNLPYYNFISDPENLEYEFFSVGPNGRIKKRVRFDKTENNARLVYNLGFGDVIGESDEVDDLNVTNNNDTEQILATIAQITITFTMKHPNYWIYIEGSTPSRTRLYHMALNKLFNEIVLIFEIYGRLATENWVLYRKGHKYELFLIRLRSH